MNKIKKILIANRGEIAVRIIAACKELGIATTAVYSQADRDSLHVRLADEAICIGPPASTESYLYIPGLISAAEIANVDAVHPGYGFLAESAHFAEICQACGLTFIGPPPAAIKLMGDKVAARERMRELGIPVLPGSDKISKVDNYRQTAREIGFPLLIKAAGGGGGKGMRVVRSEGELVNSIETAQLEAEKNFGSLEVYLEKYLETPRHIEFQILADNYGNMVHFGERECSIQRRHQKLVEECPSPFLDREQRMRAGEMITRALRAVEYQNIGTVELLFDQDGTFYFMEMNTRVQVEHPVTEMVTGFDLIKAQILIAAGEPMPVAQHEIGWSGHSIECRILAEDPETLMPSPGKISRFIPPGGPGVRVDTAAYSGWTVSPYYDSLVAKIIAYGRDRQEARLRMLRALETTVIEGIKTTIPLHLRILNDPDFIAGRLSTKFLETQISQRFRVESFP